MNGETRSESEPEADPKPPHPIPVARIVGVLLCLAAGLKVFELFDYPEEGIGWGLTLIGSSVELLVGAALIFRVWPSVCVPAAGLLFILLAHMSMIAAAREFPRCDCLGPVPMPPWAMMIVDAAAATALIWTHLASGRSRVQPVPALAAGLGAAFVGLMMGSISYQKPPPVTKTLTAQLIANSETFTIDPGRFRGRPFYLIDFIQIDADLSRGKWKVILTRSRCPRCDRRLRAGGCRPEGEERVAFVQVGGKPDWSPPEPCEGVLGYLSRDKTWDFEAPLTFRVVDGIVTEAR
jgi:hypothetical protein